MNDMHIISPNDIKVIFGKMSMPSPSASSSTLSVITQLKNLFSDIIHSFHIKNDISL